jgi:hypothetical protein
LATPQTCTVSLGFLEQQVHCCIDKAERQRENVL